MDRRHLSYCSALALLMAVQGDAIGASPAVDSNEQALKVLLSFAKELCIGVDRKGTSESIDLSGDANAKLKSALSKLVDLGIAGAAKYQSSEYEGVLQKDLSMLVGNEQDCRLEVFRDLKDKLLRNDTPATPAQGSTDISTGDNSVIVNDATIGGNVNIQK